MVDPPVPVSEFDHRDGEHLRLMYEWAGSDAKLSNWLERQGLTLAESTIGKWRRKLGVTITPGVIKTEDSGDAIRELTAYLESRSVPTCPPPSSSKSSRKYATALIGSDLHFPYHHRGAFEVFLKLAAEMQPDELVLAGDIFDWPQISKYLRKPSENRPLQDDLDACRQDILAPLNAAAPDATKRLLLGNHEHGRWQRYLWDRAPAISSLNCLTLESLIGLAEMGWVYQEHEWWPTDALCVTHGWRHTNQLGGGSAASARKQFLDMGCSGASGHTHRLGSYFRQDRSGYYTWCEIGCLCDWRMMQAAGVTSSSTPTRPEDWHTGCLRLHYHPGGSSFRLELLPILTDGGRTFCIVDGEEIVA